MIRWLTVALLQLVLCGCMHKRVVEVYRFTTCAHNGATIVCECSEKHTELNARTGAEVVVCR